MQAKAEKGLIVRAHERETVKLPSEFTVSSAQAAQIQFSPSSDSLAPNCIACTTVDISSGGAGIESRHYLPRMAEGVLRVYERDENAAERRSLLLEAQVKVRRVEMLGREARYALGLAFTNRGLDLDQRISEVLRRLHGENALPSENDSDPEAGNA